MLTGQFLETPVWGLPIVVYPFLSGLVAGSFIIASLSHAFHMKKFEPLAKLAAIVSFAMLLTAALAPLFDALQPSRAIWELYFRDHFPYSPLGVFIIVWSTYVALMLFELFYVFRPSNVERSRQDDFKGRLAKFFTFGKTDLSEEALKKDKKALTVISSIGIALAFIFHGYVGFLFGAIKARALWSNPLIPPVFIVSAIVSGIALVTLLYIVGFTFYSKKNKVDTGILSALSKYLLAAVLVDIFFNIIEWLYTVKAYASRDVYDGWMMVFGSGGPLRANYIYQILFGLLIPAALLISSKVRKSKGWGVLVSLLVLTGVYEMRFNAVMGPQLQAKIAQGSLVFHPSWTGYNGILTCAGLFGIGLTLIFVLGYIFGWEDEHVEPASITEN
ncbi:MAG: polysulfide reductase NrfD [Nitrospiraceae bacterium]|nr:polysulfide reductase NrfD [Nitrospiraceae bacterium]